ncbi:kinase-like domain-containing protein [Gigaspora rosea]|uniref:Kinase-like domain-containing protein n=1 Tax=Gigaspora rosea TaxID=44941 RepID=A0A397VVK8_9GLOM|nr:kinase-like domain-containing protein [Gigaspora rosea]
MIGRGGFGSIFKAFWEKGHIQKWCFSANEWKRSEPLWVALKSVDKDDENNEHKAFLEEAKNLHECLKINLYSLDFYGITKHPTTQKYLIVMRYAEEGDLRKYLRNNFKNFDWKSRIDKLWGLATDIRSMHEKGLVHRDLHPGNVLFGEGRRSFVSDLGLACQEGYVPIGELKGVLPYVAPELISRGSPYTKATDIYSFAFIMWECAYCMPPFCNKSFDTKLAVSICKRGKRPKVTEEIPQCYAELMQQCWNSDPDKRPTAQELVKIFEKWLEIISGDNHSDEDIKIKNQFDKAELLRPKIPRLFTLNPGAIFFSSPIPLIKYWSFNKK